MKKTITKIMAGLFVTATLAFVLVSCQKEQNLGTGSGLITSQTSSKEISPEAAGEDCGNPIPALLNVPEGNRLAYKTYATGVQIYQVQRSLLNPNNFVWANIAPSADLFQKRDYSNKVGTHYAGPSWEFTKGSYRGEKAVATKLQGITVDPTAIPWLLLQVLPDKSSAGNKVTYIQRVCTTGGLAPSTPATESNLGVTESVPYTATYLFFEKK